MSITEALVPALRRGPRSTRATSLPGPDPLPILGALGNVARFSRDIVGNMGLLFERYGRMAAVVGGDLNEHPALARWVLGYGPDFARDVIGAHRTFHKPPLTKHLYPRGDQLTERQRALQRWGTGLFFVNEDEHKAHRTIMAPAFHKKRVDAFAADIATLTEKELQTWQPGAIRDMRHAMMQLTLRIAARCLLGEEMAEHDKDSVGELIRVSIRQLLRPSVSLLPVDLPGTPYHAFLNAVVRTEDAIRGILAAKRASGAEGGDVLSMLLHARDAEGGTLTEDELIGHTGVLIIAGHETSSNALMWALLLLSQHPQVAADLLDELDGVLHGAAPTVEQVARLPLLDAVIKESMRLLPSVAVNIRIVGHEVELQGQTLPVGTTVVVSVYHTHRMPELYPNPARFDPRRWETFKPGLYEYQPFGAGPRMCIGTQFAMLEMKIILAMVLQRFRLELPSGTRVDRHLSVAMTVKDRLPMLVHKQDRAFSHGARGFSGNVREMVDLVA